VFHDLDRVSGPRSAAGYVLLSKAARQAPRRGSTPASPATRDGFRPPTSPRMPKHASPLCILGRRLEHEQTVLFVKVASGPAQRPGASRGVPPPRQAGGPTDGTRGPVREGRGSTGRPGDRPDRQAGRPAATPRRADGHVGRCAGSPGPATCEWAATASIRASWSSPEPAGLEARRYGGPRLGWLPERNPRPPARSGAALA
jgi:hypothetical protein